MAIGGDRAMASPQKPARFYPASRATAAAAIGESAARSSARIAAFIRGSQ
jgi:hypothetical protein